MYTISNPHAKLLEIERAGQKDRKNAIKSSKQRVLLAEVTQSHRRHHHHHTTCSTSHGGGRLYLPGLKPSTQMLQQPSTKLTL